jgi:hypothetical protein
MRTVMIGFWIAVLFPLNTQAQTIPELGFPTPTQTLPSNISFSSFNKEYASDAVFSPKGELFIANSSQIIKYQQQKPQVLGSLKDANIQAFAISAKGTPVVAYSLINPTRNYVAQWDGKNWLPLGSISIKNNYGFEASLSGGRLLQRKNGQWYYIIDIESECAPGSCEGTKVFSYDGKTWRSIPTPPADTNITKSWRAATLDQNDNLFITSETKTKIKPDDQMEVRQNAEFGVYKFDGKKWSLTGKFPSTHESALALEHDAKGNVLLGQVLKDSVLVQQFDGKVWSKLGLLTLKNVPEFNNLDISMTSDAQGSMAVAVTAARDAKFVPTLFTRDAKTKTWASARADKNVTWLRVASLGDTGRVVWATDKKISIGNLTLKSTTTVMKPPVSANRPQVTSSISTKAVNFWIGTWYSTINRNELRIEKQKDALLIFYSNQAMDGFISDLGTLVVRSPFGNVTGNYDSDTKYLLFSNSLYTKNRALAAKIHLEKAKKYANDLMVKFLSDTALGFLKSYGQVWGKDSCFQFFDAPSSVLRCGYSTDTILNSISVSILPYLGEQFLVSNTSLPGFGKALSLEKFQGNFIIGGDRGSILKNYYLQLDGKEQNGIIGKFITEESPYSYYAICTYSLVIVNRLSNAIVVESKLAQAAETFNGKCSSEVISFSLLWNPSDNQLYTTYSFGGQLCSGECGNYRLVPTYKLPNVENPPIAVQITFPTSQSNPTNNTSPAGSIGNTQKPTVVANEDAIQVRVSPVNLEVTPGRTSDPLDVFVDSKSNEPIKIALDYSAGAPLPVGIRYDLRPPESPLGKGKWTLRIHLAATYPQTEKDLLIIRIRAYTSTQEKIVVLSYNVKSLEAFETQQRDNAGILRLKNGQIMRFPVEKTTKDYLISSDPRSRIYVDVDVLNTKKNTDGSVDLRLKAVNLGLSDGLAEIYDANGKLISLKVIKNDPVPESVVEGLGGILFNWKDGQFILGTGLESTITLGKVIWNQDSNYANQDFPNRTRTTIEANIPAGGYVRFTKSSAYALYWNFLKAMVKTGKMLKGFKTYDENALEENFLKEVIRVGISSMSIINELFNDENSVKALFLGQLSGTEYAKTVEYFISRIIKIDFGSYIGSGVANSFLTVLEEGAYNLEKIISGSTFSSLELTSQIGQLSNVFGLWVETYENFRFFNNSYTLDTMEFFNSEMNQTNILGNVNLQEYCQSTYGTAIQVAQAVLIEQNAYGWRCKVTDNNSTPLYYDINVTDACQSQYGSGAQDAYRDFDDPYSWYCSRE